MPLRWGFCGAGRISNDFAASIASLNSDEHSLVAVAARDLQNAQKFATLFGFDKAYDKYEDIAKDENVDVVYVGLINTKHYEVVKKMIEAGKHVLCEKPLTLVMDQLTELFALAESKQVFLMEAIWSRCFPVYDRIRDALNSGAIGEVQAVTCFFGVPINNVQRTWDKVIGGGGLVDIGIYVVQFALMAFGGRMPEEVVAGATMLKGVDESGNLFMKYEDGKFANVGYSCKLQMKNGATIYGSKGNIEIPDFFWTPTEVIIMGEKFEEPRPISKFKLEFPGSEGLAYEAEEVRRCIESKKLISDKISHQDSIKIHTIMHSALKQFGFEYQS